MQEISSTKTKQQKKKLLLQGSFELVCWKYFGLDLPVNTKHSFEVPKIPTDFLEHIQNSENCHSTKSDLHTLLNVFSTVIFLNSISNK